MVPIERREGVTIYGKVINHMGRLGQFEVVSDKLGNNGSVYTEYKEAANRMKALIGTSEDEEYKRQQIKNSQRGNQKQRR